MGGNSTYRARLDDTCNNLTDHHSLCDLQGSWLITHFEVWLGHVIHAAGYIGISTSLSLITGPSTVAGMAAAKGWTSSIVPGILISTAGYTIGSFLGIGMGNAFFKGA